MESTTKDEYINKELAHLTQYWVNNVFLVAIILFPLLGLMDYYVAPELYATFLIYRIAVTLLMVVLYLLNKVKISINYQYILVTIGLTLAAATIQLMVLALGGHRSTYYAGQNLVVITVLGFVPVSVTVALIGAIIVYSVYLFPILLFDHIIDVPQFISNNAFMISTFIITLMWRLFSQRRLLNELGLQYELNIKNAALENYSNSLEQEVASRTKELRKSEQWHRALYENATDGIIVIDRNGIIVNVNEKACEMHGFPRESLIGTNISLLEISGDRGKVAERMRNILSGATMVFESVHNKKDGSLVYFEISSKAVVIDDEQFIQSFYRDITEKKQMHEYLLQSQKMESIGVLTGGIAHDFSNILTAILVHIEVMRRAIATNARAMTSLSIVRDGIVNASNMVSKLLGFSRKTDYDIVSLNLNDVVKDTVRLLERVVGPNIAIRLKLNDKLSPVIGDFTQLEQVVMNFIVNARDAMPKGGDITITTDYRTITKGMRDVPPYVTPGQYVQLTVSDTGVGIPEGLLNKIFEPFFTTKDRDKGTGLGLAMAYGVIKDHKGYIAVQSQLGSGSSFSVYLPACESSAMPERTASKMQVSNLGGYETLLVVDDDIVILEGMRETLTAHGYNVLATDSPMKALDIFRIKHEQISLVITDMAMPNINGQDLINSMKEIYPSINILAISGNTRYVVGKDDIKDIASFVQKPFDSPHLLSLVRRLLDSKEASSPIS
jgi:PAS domain S-box-containing protein